MQIKTLIKKMLSRFGIIHPSMGVKISPEKKALALLQYKSPTTNIFIETGTEYGWMIERIGDKFEQIFSIELDDNLFNRAQKFFSNKSNLRLFHGDSSVEIKKVLEELKKPALFWLDAHGSGEITAENSPIIKELEAIFSHGVARHVILIDDARHFKRETIKIIRKLAQSNNYAFEIEDGIFRLVPNSSLSSK